MNYTKGEWEADDITIIDNKGNIIAIVELPESPWAENQNIAEANAYLIAAAPEMYEALKGILNLCNGYATFPKDLVAKAIKQALTKAEGK